MRSAGRPRGFTLVELMVIVALLALLAGMAIPNFNRLINNNRTQSSSSEVQGLLQFARTYAVDHHTSVHVCFSSGAISVSTACSGGTVLRSVALPQDVVIAASATDLLFRQNGTAGASARYTVCRGTDAANGFSISVMATGNIRTFPRGRGGASTDMANCNA